MKKILILIALAALTVYAASIVTQIIAVPPLLGNDAFNNGNAAANWTAIAFIPTANRTITAARVTINNVTGILGTSDTQLDTYNDNGSGKPGSSLGCATTTVNAAPSAGSPVIFTNVSCSVSAGQPYYLVLKNLNGTPSGNYFGVRYGNAYSTLPNIASNGTLPGVVLTTTNSGSSWSIITNQMAYYRIDYADGTYDGYPIVSTSFNDSTNKIYSGRELGSVFTGPPVAINVSGISMYVASTGTPTGSPRMAIYTGTSGTLSNLGYSNCLPTVAAGSRCLAVYNPPVQIPANSTIRVVAGETSNSDASTKYYGITRVVFDNDSHSTSLLPFQGTIQGTYCTGACTTASNWAQTSATYYPFVLYLDSAAEFTAPASGAPHVVPIVGWLQSPDRWFNRLAWAVTQ